MIKPVIERAAILELIPHQGQMCLHDRVLQWDDTSIDCETLSHLDLENPLRSEDQLAAVILAEYGAQAMAIHGGLLAQQSGNRAMAGYLAGIRNLKLQANRIDDLSGPLRITATQRLLNASGSLYDFTAKIENRLLATGRTSVIYQPS